MIETPVAVQTSKVDFTRDRWRRPIIDGEVQEQPSKIAKALDEAGGLPMWYGRMVAEGLKANPGLMYQGWDSSRVAKEAMQAAGAWDGRDYGTGIHDEVRRFLLGGPKPTEAGAIAVLDALATARLTVVASELKVWDRTRGCAGTLDLLLLDEIQGVTFVGDIKTTNSDVASAINYNSRSWSIQTGLYAGGVPVDDDLVVRSWEEMGLMAPNQDNAIVIHLDRTSGRAAVVEVGIEPHLIDLALSVTAIRRHEVPTTIQFGG